MNQTCSQNHEAIHSLVFLINNQRSRGHCLARRAYIRHASWEPFSTSATVSVHDRPVDVHEPADTSEPASAGAFRQTLPSEDFGIWSGGPIFFPRACDRGTIPGRLTDVDIPSPLPSQPLRFTWALRLPSAWASASSRAPCGRYVDPPTHRPARPARCSDYENIRDFPANLSPSPFPRNHRPGTFRHAPSRRRTSRASRRSKRGTNPRA